MSMMRSENNSGFDLIKSEKWQFHFNANKCKTLHLGAGNPQREYKLDGVKIPETKEEKDLCGH